MTFRLAGTIPAAALAELHARLEAYERELPSDLPGEQVAAMVRRRRLAWTDRILDRGDHGPSWLADDRIAGIVVRALEYLEGRDYDLDAWVVMPNHVHALIRPSSPDEKAAPAPLGRIVHSIKRYSARESNALLGRKGQFWQREWFDHWIRDPVKLEGTRRYIEHNPVAAGLCREPPEWPHGSAARAKTGNPE